MSKNYYEILGVERDSSYDDIRKAYKSLSRRYHPDISEENNAEEMMAKINVAYDILSDSDKRFDYDSELHFSENNIYDEDAEFSYNDFVTTKIMSWTTVILGILFWTCSIIAYTVLNWNDVSNVFAIFNYSIFDIALMVIAVLFVCLLLYYMSYIFIYLLVFWMVISLSLEYDSAIVVVLITYVGIYLSLIFILGVDQDVLRWIGLIFLLIFLFNDFIFNNIILFVLIAGLTYSIAVTIFIFWSLMEPYGIEYVYTKHILMASLLLPFLGGVLMFVAYGIEEWW